MTCARDEPPGERTRALHVAILIGLTLATLGLRLTGLEHALPHMIEQDAEIVAQVDHLREGRMSPRVRRGWPTYPLLVAYLTCLTPAPERPAADADVPLARHLQAATATTVDVRRTVAVLSVLVVPAVFLLARRFMSPGWSLFAAALIAFSVLSQSLAQQARPHALAAVFVAWGLLAAVDLRRGWASHGLAALLLFGALSTIHSGVALCLPMVWAYFGRSDRARLLEAPALLLPVALALAVAIGYPFLLEQGSTGVEEGGITFGTHDVMAHWFTGGGVPTLAWALWSYEPVLSILALLGVVLWGVRGARETRALWSPRALVLMSYAVPYLVVLGIFRNTVDRFVIPALPCLAVLAAWGLARLSRGRSFGRAVGALAVLSLAVPGFAAAKLALIRARPDTLSEAAVWIEAGLEQGERVFLAPRPSAPNQNSSIDLPLARSDEGLAGPGGAKFWSYNEWTHYQRQVGGLSGPFPRYDLFWSYAREKDMVGYRPPRDQWLAEHPRHYFASTGPGLYVIEDFRGRHDTGTIALRQALALVGELVLRISPDGDPEWTTFPQLYRDPDSTLPDQPGRPTEDWPHVTWRLLQARAWGPVVEIYRIRAEDLEG